MKQRCKGVSKKVPVHDLFLARCQDTKTTPSADREKRFAQSIVGSCSERVLDLRELGFRRLAAEALATWLASEETFVSLVLANNELGDGGAAALCLAMLRNTTVTHLDVRSNSITANGARALFESLEANSTLTSIDFGTAIGVRRNAMGVRGAKALAAVLARNRVLSCIYIRDTGLGMHGGEALAAGIRVSDSLARVDLSANQLGPAGCVVVCAALIESSAPLEHLNLSGNAVGNPGADAIAKLLAAHQTLESVDISSNAIGPAGMAAIGKALLARVQPAAIVSFNAADNSAGNLGVADLARWVANSRTLKTLVLAGNAISSGSELAAAVLASRSLVRLDLRRNALGAAGAAAILGVLAGNERSALGSLDLAGNRIDGSAGIAIAKLIAGNVTLQHLSLRDNRLDKAAGTVVAASMAHNTTLLTLNVDVGNNIAYADHAIIEQQLRKNRTAWERNAPAREAAMLARLRENVRQLHEIEHELAETVSQGDEAFDQKEEAEHALEDTKEEKARAVAAARAELAQRESDVLRISEAAGPGDRAELRNEMEGRRKQLIGQIQEQRGVARKLTMMVERLSNELRERVAEFAEEREELTKQLNIASFDLQSSASDIPMLRQKVAEMRAVLSRMEEHTLVTATSSVVAPHPLHRLAEPSLATTTTAVPVAAAAAAAAAAAPVIPLVTSQNGSITAASATTTQTPMLPRMRGSSMDSSAIPERSFSERCMSRDLRTTRAISRESTMSTQFMSPPEATARAPSRPARLAPLKPPPLPTDVNDGDSDVEEDEAPSPPLPAAVSMLRTGRLRSASVTVPPLEGRIPKSPLI